MDFLYALTAMRPDEVRRMTRDMAESATPRHMVFRGRRVSFEAHMEMSDPPTEPRERAAQR
jgi:hypothetical protein